MEPTDIQIQEGNELIGDFMELKRHPNGMCDDPTRNYFSFGMRYHAEWNWIMPVIEKIETMNIKLPEKYRRGFLKNSTYVNIEVSTFYDQREDFKGWEAVVSFVLGSPLFDYNIKYNSKIEATWHGVVKFIKWYNNNIKNDESTDKL